LVARRDLRAGLRDRAVVELAAVVRATEAENPAVAAEALAWEGLALFDANETERAAHLLREALRHDPHSTLAAGALDRAQARGRQLRRSK
jgi:Tfp pilus assembly protein PilF